MKKLNKELPFQEISWYVDNSKLKITNEINYRLIFVRWNIGKEIFKHKQQYNELGVDFVVNEKTIKTLSQKLSKKYGNVFSSKNLLNMFHFYSCYQEFDLISKQELTWSHYLEFINIFDENKRKFYEIETIKRKWTTKQLQKQIKSLLYERLQLASTKNEKKLIYDEIKKEKEPKIKSKIIFDPFLLEYFDLQEEELNYRLEDKKRIT